MPNRSRSLVRTSSARDGPVPSAQGRRWSASERWGSGDCFLNKLVLRWIGVVTLTSSFPHRWRGAGGLVEEGSMLLFLIWRGVSFLCLLLFIGVVLLCCDARRRLLLVLHMPSRWGRWRMGGSGKSLLNNRGGVSIRACPQAPPIYGRHGDADEGDAACAAAGIDVRRDVGALAATEADRQGGVYQLKPWFVDTIQGQGSCSALGGGLSPSSFFLFLHWRILDLGVGFISSFPPSGFVPGGVAAAHASSRRRAAVMIKTKASIPFSCFFLGAWVKSARTYVFFLYS